LRSGARQAYVKSEAALRIARELPRWQWTWVFHFIPRVIRDAIYDLVARNLSLLKNEFSAIGAGTKGGPARDLTLRDVRNDDVARRPPARQQYCLPREVVWDEAVGSLS
jgi:DCC1-like thiol-disulfide oxidoreductase